MTKIERCGIQSKTEWVAERPFVFKMLRDKIEACKESKRWARREYQQKVKEMNKDIVQIKEDLKTTKKATWEAWRDKCREDCKREGIEFIEPTEKEEAKASDPFKNPENWKKLGQQLPQGVLVV